MYKKQKYERFPIRTVFIRAIIGLVWIFSAIALMYQSGAYVGTIFTIYLSLLFLFILKTACTRCDYYGIRCDTGLGKVSAWFFSKNTDRFQFACKAKKTLLPIIIFVISPIIFFILEVLSSITFFSIIFMTFYVFSLSLLVITNRTLSCPHCKMNDICPIGQRLK